MNIRKIKIIVKDRFENTGAWGKNISFNNKINPYK